MDIKDFEEMWVIKEIEHFAASALQHQGRRNSHRKLGKFRAQGVFSNVGDETYIYPVERRH